MSLDRDGYEAYYAAKLWASLPAMYREDDGESTLGLDSQERGPLRELVDRIGAQAAVLRRSIDRMWEDHSVETADDWLVPYIGDLLATNLVAGMGAREQRLDVAKTIYYRRRKGTLGILEEIAHDVTGWDARVVEEFRHLARYRHLLDPAIGRPADTPQPAAARELQAAQGLIGRYSRTPIGGTADLRAVYPASRTSTAFDEFAHTIDVRAGRGHVGWFNIPRLGVFLWRLRSFNVVEGTPVPVKGCPGMFTFDPTGRSIPLFAAASRPLERFGARWISPEEWQLPTPIDRRLFRAATDQLYPGSIEVFAPTLTGLDTIPSGNVTILPACGRFVVTSGNVPNPQASYHYGFSAEIGAGPYDRRIRGETNDQPPDPVNVLAGGGTLVAALTGLRSGTVRLGDSQTYDAVADVGAAGAGIGQVRIDSENTATFSRPCIRPPAGAWTFTGDPSAELVLDGLLVSGVDIVLAGSFDLVRIACSTLDPGNSGLGLPTPAIFADAADGRELRPSRLWIEGTVRSLEIERSIVGPIRTRGNGHVERLQIRDSIVQAIRTTDPAGPDPADLAIELAAGTAVLDRCTVLGPIGLHRLEASETILDDLAIVEDPQHGCVRFSATSVGSVLPRQYESVQVDPGAPVFTTREYGMPGFGQLLGAADRAIRSSSSPRPSITQGGPTGGEMGAFATELGAVRRRGLLIKFREYMPVGMGPVLVDVT
jgi:hypothetical protein